jgi:hypothetical protein
MWERPLPLPAYLMGVPQRAGGWLPRHAGGGVGRGGGAALLAPGQQLGPRLGRGRLREGQPGAGRVPGSQLSILYILYNSG